MSITSSDPNRYYRTGIAMPLPRKPAFDERLHALGFRTLGDLVTMFALTDGVVEALAPIAARFRQDQMATKSLTGRRQDLLKQLKLLPARELQHLMSLAASQSPIDIATDDEPIADNEGNSTRTANETNV
jgi:hypothetical protein